MQISKLLRKNIAQLKPYASARDEFSGEASIYLDANENPYNSPYNRYPDPLQKDLKKRVGAIKRVDTKHIFLGNGSDEAIDLLFRAFCQPGVDNVVSIDPTYGMYKVCADINDVEVKKVLLNEDFSLNVHEILRVTNEHSKILFLCSPNNPTGNLLNRKEVEFLITRFPGLVVLDEAYIDFCPSASLLPDLEKYPNLVILQTFSKAWAMAGMRLGMAFAVEEIIQVFNAIKYPYNINILTQRKGLAQLTKQKPNVKWMRTILKERDKMVEDLNKIPFVVKVYPSDSNFLLVKVTRASALYKFLIDRSIVIRDRSNVQLCDECLRITIGTPEENENLIRNLYLWG